MNFEQIEKISQIVANIGVTIEIRPDESIHVRPLVTKQGGELILNTSSKSKDTGKKEKPV